MIDKIQKSRRRRGSPKAAKFKNQRGVTLLIAILILSGLALISSSIAVFTMQEIRASRASLATEPAIVAAEGAGERGVFALKRLSTTNCNPTDPSAGSSLVSGQVYSSYTVTRQSATVNIEPGRTMVVYLYDPCDINGDVDLLAYPYTSFTMDCISGNAIANYSVTRLDGTTAGISPASGTVCPVSTAPSKTVIISPVSTAGMEGRMKILISSSSTVTLKLNTDRGMPNAPTVNAVACGTKGGNISNCTSGNELFSRRISISLPTGALSSTITPTPPPTDTWLLSVSNSPGAGGSISGGGINCGSVCTNTFIRNPQAAPFTLTATPTGGYTFGSWTGCDSPSGNTCTMTMNANKTVTATYNPPVTPTLTWWSGATCGSGTANVISNISTTPLVFSTIGTYCMQVNTIFTVKFKGAGGGGGGANSGGSGGAAGGGGGAAITSGGSSNISLNPTKNYELIVGSGGGAGAAGGFTRFRNATDNIVLILLNGGSGGGGGGTASGTAIANGVTGGNGGGAGSSGGSTSGTGGGGGGGNGNIFTSDPCVDGTGNNGGNGGSGSFGAGGAGGGPNSGGGGGAPGRGNGGGTGGPCASGGGGGGGAGAAFTEANLANGYGGGGGGGAGGSSSGGSGGSGRLGVGIIVFQSQP